MRRVLVISPTDLTPHLGRTVLWRNDVDRAFASDLAEGHEAARSWAPNLVVLDGAERHGAERLVRTLRSDAATRQRAIAVVSRATLLADAADFRLAGVNVVLPPYANPAVWDARLAELLNVPPRRDTRIPVRLEPWSRADRRHEVIEGRALNISVNGLLIESSSPLEAGQKLDLRFLLPGSAEEFQGVGEVVWRQDQPHSGIRFLVLRGEARDAIGSFVEGGAVAATVSSTPARKGAPAHDDEWEAELRESEVLKTAILESSLDAIIMLTQEGRVVDINRAAENALGYPRADLVGRTIMETIAPPSARDPHRQSLAFALATADPAYVGQRTEMTVKSADDGEIPVELTTTTTSSRGRSFYTIFLRDLRPARRMEALQVAARRITDASAVAEGLEDLCKAIHMFVAEVTYAKNFSIALAEGSSERLIVPYAVEDGDQRPGVSPIEEELADRVRASGQPLMVPSPPTAGMGPGGASPPAADPNLQWLGVPLKKHGRAFGIVAVWSRDPDTRVTEEHRQALVLLAPALGVALERKQAEARIYHLAYYDPLTGLPNRHLMLDRLELGIAQAARDRNHLGVLFVDLDQFKVINDSLGHSTGDQVIKEAANRLVRHVRKGDTLARIGGDKFAVVIRGLRDPADAAKVAQILQSSLGEPLHVAERELFVTACVGISTSPDDGTDVETLLKNADTALHRAKEQGHDSFRMYDASMNAEAVQRLRLEHGLRRALARDELVTYYQPLVDLATGEIHCVEALLRWRHPERGLVLPGEFIPLAETTGMIRSIGSWGLRTACAQVRAWRDQGYARLSLAINLSARQLHNMNVVTEVTSALRESGLPPGFLELEITESSAMVNAEATIRALEALKDLGVRISIDDFGIGYSSMSQLQRLPIDNLKIDQSFVRDLTTDPNDAAIVRAIITLAHTLKLSVVAEGVETAQQLAFLAEQNCDRIQGFVIAHPLPAEECGPLLASHSAEHWRMPSE